MNSKKIVISILSILLILIVLTGCGDKEEKKPSNNKKESDKKEIYTIDLEMNQTSGYTWLYSYSENTIVEVYKFDYVADDENITPEEALKLERTGVMRYQFRGLTPGKVTITFEYKQPWNEKAKPAKIKKITLVVDDDKMISESTEEEKDESDNIE